MKMKLLDYTLICLLAGIAPNALAQEGAGVGDGSGTGQATLPPSEALPGDVSCGVDNPGCVTDDDILLKVRTRGERAPLPVEDGESRALELQGNRRVTVEAAGPGKAVAIGKWSVQLPDGGVLWATEDPNLGQPAFNISASSLVPFDGERITKPVRFHAYNNYPDFIDHAEILVFRATDVDLVDPLATVPMEVAAVSDVEWDGTLPEGFEARAGDEMTYIVRAYGPDGSFDETYPRRFQLVQPQEAERGSRLLRDSVEREYGTRFSEEEAEERRAVDEVFGENALRQQNIPIYGSRIRLQGRDIPEGRTVRINGQSQPVDLERKLVAEYLVPIGEHSFDVEVSGADGDAVHERIDIDVTGKYLFAVALADMTLSDGKASGSIEPLGDEREQYEGDLLLEGRFAFYLKGKVKGKYLVTAQADTQEREVSELFDGFWDADPQDIFRRLDPDDYYPVYGDDSTTYRDIDTMGRLYVRVDWDKNQALWGNFNTGITGTEYAQYSRSLYGGAVNWRSRRSTALGEPGSELRGFASEAQTVPGHTEFLGTGGSLYYLKHTDILPGSDKVVLEIRDNTTGRVQNRVPLLQGADYELDNFQGRIILTRPLAQVTRENLPTLTRDTPLDGYSQVLLVDYEYLPTGFDADEVTAGFRGKHWFGDHVAVGATYVDENRAGEDYTLMGADLTLQAGRGTYLQIEQTRTEATSAPVWYSDNGGLSFSELNSGRSDRDGDATAVEGRVNFKELGWTRLDWSAGAWWRQVDAGFSIARLDTGADIEEQGAEVLGQFAPNFNVYARYSVAERDDESLTQGQFTAEWRITDHATISGEIRRVEEDRSGGDANGTLGALQYKHRFGNTLDLFATAQLTLDDDGGRYADNDAFTVGGKYLFGELSSVGAEFTTGDRGDAAQVNAEYRINQDYTLYGAYTYSTDRSPYDPLFNDRLNTGWTLGQRWRISNRATMYNESQFLKDPQGEGLTHLFGMDFYPGIGWNLGFTLQSGELENAGGIVDRKAVSVNGGRTSNDTQWQSKVEWREDTGAERREQWVTTNRLTHKFNESFRIAARVNYSQTDDEIDPLAGAKFIESNLGFAWRPWNSTRYALFGRYTYLYDVSSLEQVGDNLTDYDQRSQILSFEGVYKPDTRWEFAGKLMRRWGEVRFGRLEGDWAESDTTFAAAQARYAFADKWNSLVEYRWLSVDEGGDRQGFLLGIDRDIGDNFRVGLGYNFTEFSDDLTDFDYDHRGWFLNVVGRY